MRKEPKKIAARKQDTKTRSHLFLLPAHPTSLCWTIFLPGSALFKSLTETSPSPNAYVVRIQVPESIQCLRFPPPNFLSLTPALMSHTSCTVPYTAFYKHCDSVLCSQEAFDLLYIHQRCSPHSILVPHFHDSILKVTVT